MSIKTEVYGKLDGSEVLNFTLDNGRGLRAEILNLGGIIKNLYFDGTDVVLGQNGIEAYSKNPGYLGALIGRNSNRIENAEFVLGGKTYRLAANDNGVCNLHGGNCGFNRKIWSAKTVDSDEPSLILSTFSPDGEEGFPSDVSVTVTYTLTKDNSIKIRYEGTSTDDTVLNMTNHSYFNLNGHKSGTVDGHTVQLESSFYTPNNADCIPTGEILTVSGTPFDFRKPRRLGDAFAEPHSQTKLFGGFDHNFVLDGRGFRRIASIKGDKTGISMDVFTDLPGVQLYTANSLEAWEYHKDGATYGVHHAMCLETQYFPNALKFSHFQAPILKGGCKYDTTTEYKFSK